MMLQSAGIVVKECKLKYKLKTCYFQVLSQI
jgi:hypothetical protein